MTYYSTTHPIRRLFGRHGLGAIDQAGTGATAGEYMTSLTPYNITPVQAQYVPNTIVNAMQAAGFPAGYVRSGWSDMGHLFVVFLPATGWTATQRRAALTTAIRAAERSVASDAKLLLPGESAPSGAAPTTAPPGTPTSAPSGTAPAGRTSGGTVGQSVPTSDVQSLLLRKGYTLAGGADNTFGTATANALRLALSAIGRYVVLGGQVTTYTVSSDKHSIAFSSGTWEALQSAPNASGGGTQTVLPDGTIVTTPGGGPDWGTIAPFLIGGGVLVAAGAYFMLKKKPRQKLTVRNGRRVRRNATNFDDMVIHVMRHPAGLSWIETLSGFRDDDLVFEDSDEFHTEKDALDDAVGAAEMWLDKGVTTALVIDGRGNEYWSGSSGGKRKYSGRTQKNPIPHGYSRKTMGKIIGIERRAGKSPEQASAIAYSIARKAARRAGVRPGYLRNTRGGR
jgi:hypothetical protein